MPALSKEELSAVRIQLENESRLIGQFTVCAHTAADPQLRTFFEQIAARHRVHWDTLTKLLSMESEA